MRAFDMKGRHHAPRLGGLTAQVALGLAVCFFSSLLTAPLFAQGSRSSDSLAIRPRGDRANWPSREVVFLDRLFQPRREGFASSGQSPQPPADNEIRPYRSLLNGLRPGLAPKRAVALQFAEKGRRLLQSGAYQRSLNYFERALGLGAGPYIYYYLAQAHYRLAHMKESLQFLDVAETLLAGESDWIAEVESLRAKFHSAPVETRRNFRPIGWPVH